MRHWIFFVALVGLWKPSVATAELLEGVAAEVGSELIFLTEVEERAYALQMAQGRPVDDNMRRGALEELVNETILVLYARDQEIEASDLEIEEATNRQVEQVRSTFPSEEAFAAALAAEDLTIERLKENYRKATRDKILRDKVMFTEIYDRVEVSRREIRRYYEDHAVDIEKTPRVYRYETFDVPVATMSPAGEELLATVQAGIEGPEAFKLAAKKHSEDSWSAERGGELGWVQPSDLVNELSAEVQALDVGQMSDVVRSRFGYHLLYVHDRGIQGSHVFHILRVAPPSEEDAERQKTHLEALRGSIESGDRSWANAVAEESFADGMAGLLAKYEERETAIEEDLRSALASMKPGEISAPLVRAMHVSLVRLESVKGGETPALELIVDQLGERLRWAKVSERFDEWVSDRREQTYVRLVAPFAAGK